MLHPFPAKYAPSPFIHHGMCVVLGTGREKARSTSVSDIPSYFLSILFPHALSLYFALKRREYFSQQYEIDNIVVVYRPILIFMAFMH
jgi:hypothetical protein